MEAPTSLRKKVLRCIAAVFAEQRPHGALGASQQRIMSLSRNETNKCTYPLVNIANWKMAMEIVDFPIEDGGSFYSKLLVITRGYLFFFILIPCNSLSPFENSPEDSSTLPFSPSAWNSRNGWLCQEALEPKSIQKSRSCPMKP